MKILLLGTLLTIAVIFVGCNGGDNHVKPSTVNSFISLMETHYGGNFTVVKKGPSETLTTDFIVVYSEESGEFMAYDFRTYVSGMSWCEYMGNIEYNPVVIHDTFLGYYGGNREPQVMGDLYVPRQVYYVGDAYESNSGQYMGQFVFEETEMAVKDLEKLGAFQEAYNISAIANGLVADYELSEQRSKKIAKMAMEWKKLSSTRSMTSNDVSAVVKKVFGVELHKANEVMMKLSEGNTNLPDDFIKAASEANEISPEHLNSIFTSYFK